MDIEDLAVMDADALIKKYGHWGEHPDHPLHTWQSDVANDDTRLGYWQWVANEKQLADENK